MDNAKIESFNGRLRLDCLNEHWLMSFEDAREKVESWRRDYNKNRPHSSLDNTTPEEFAAQIEPETEGLNRDFEAAKNGLHIKKLADKMNEKRGAGHSGIFSHYAWTD